MKAHALPQEAMVIITLVDMKDLIGSKDLTDLINLIDMTDQIDLIDLISLKDQINLTDLIDSKNLEIMKDLTDSNQETENLEKDSIISVIVAPKKTGKEIIIETLETPRMMISIFSHKSTAQN